MRVLVACECSGIVRDAFAALGHDAWSCDLKPAEGKHFQQDVFDACGIWPHLVEGDWDLMIAHPPCTHLAVSGARWFKHKRTALQDNAIWFFKQLYNAPIPKICIENPVCIMSTVLRKPDQIVQPYEYGDDASKKTCLWLRGLPLLKPTGPFISGRMVGGKPRWANQTNSGQNRLAPSADRAAIRAKTYPGIAQAMAEQWGKLYE